ncbi:hypothetical protein TUM4438_44830 [Shewanella sairae]|uniref:HTH cro/C1-type domain-containing protein n=1 Tax=Shewanella sairae TaxID=190310 RepID=A0ABQ4PRL3_9GAMM|nr:helix-turn-helix domain-containing protein [Shewanella sairae]MCL1132674.1 transcriptional regulator [Shewanella sairae]GIU52342.1 hypothetical protein TUM4438_44830 [Shewanella sairae]
MNLINLINASHAIKDFIPFSNIGNEEDYNAAINIMDAITNDYDESLSVIIDVLAPKISEYEDSLEELVEFNDRISSMNPSSTMLRVIMEHHHLKTTDFKDEIGGKSLVSMIVNGKRNLTVDHIKNLSNRFDISPNLFF